MSARQKTSLIGIGRNTAVTLFFLALCTGVAAILSTVNDDNNPFATCLFVLAVALVARFTTGYVYGIIASVVSVACVNYLFTVPFFQFDLSVTGYPLTFASMLVVSVIVSAMSTRLRRQERIRFEAQQEKMRANLLRSISHDLRTPLTSIIGVSSALLENRTLSRPEQEDMLDEIQKDARWLNRAMENILSLTKVNAGGVKLKKNEEIVEEIVGSAIVKYHKRKETLPVRVTGTSEILLVPMDALLIEQVLLNLFENAEIHGETATKIELMIQREQERVVFCVSDDGKGLSEAQLSNPFEFDPVPDGKSGVGGHRNMGIGLSVCHTVIAAHGGGMSAYNNKTGGATIQFWLPLDEGENEQ